MTKPADSMTEYREDIGGGILSRIDENGYLRVEGIAARTGVLTYLLPNGTVRRELVTPECLFAEDSVSSLIGAPVTIDHPGILNADTATQYQRCSVPSASADGDKLKVSVVVTANDAIEQVNLGKHQLSPGYRAELDYTPGEYNGQQYDAVQTKRVYNHLAVVQNARGGTECRLHLDSLAAEGVICAVETQPTTDEVKTMPSVKLHSGATVEVADASTASAIQAEINQLGQRADAADDMVDKAKYDELQGKYDALKEKMDKMEAEAKEREDSRMDADEIGAYIETIEAAKKLKADIQFKQDGKYMDATAVMAAALGIDASGKSAEYIKGRFDSAIELSKGEEVRKQRENRQDSGTVVITGRAKFMAEQLKRGA